jgi:hypothetical protein
MRCRTATIRVAAVVATLCAMLLAGCTQNVSGTAVPDPRPAPAEGPGSDPVAWVDKVCGSLLQFVQAAGTAPDIGSAPDPAAVKKSLSDYLGSIVTGVRSGREQLRTVGRSPVGGGDETVAKLDQQLDRLEREFSAAKAKVDAANPNDPAAFGQALTEVGKSLNEVTTSAELGELSTMARFNKAAEQAPSCQQLRQLSGR